MATMTKKYIDCSEFPSTLNCTLRISGTEEEVLRAAREHAISTHGHKDSPELRQQLQGAIHSET